MGENKVSYLLHYIFSQVCVAAVNFPCDSIKKFFRQTLQRHPLARKKESAATFFVIVLSRHIVLFLPCVSHNRFERQRGGKYFVPLLPCLFRVLCTKITFTTLCHSQSSFYNGSEIFGQVNRLRIEPRLSGINL